MISLPLRRKEQATNSQEADIRTRTLAVRLFTVSIAFVRFDLRIIPIYASLNPGFVLFLGGFYKLLTAGLSHFISLALRLAKELSIVFAADWQGAIRDTTAEVFTVAILPILDMRPLVRFRAATVRSGVIDL
jgi:hypothetical protein